MHTRIHRSRGGFTLIEILVVVAIIAVLVAITLAVGAAVVGGAKANATRDVLRVMDQIAGNYATQEDGNADPVTHHPEDWARVQRGELDEADVRLVVVADARWQDTQLMLNSVGWFLQQASEKGLGEQFGGLDSRFSAVHTPRSDQGSATSGLHPPLPTALDAWGRPVRYVHPKFDGQIVRDHERAEGDPGGYVNVAADQSGYLFGREESRWLNESPGSMLIRRNGVLPAEFGEVPEEQRDSDGGICPTDRPYFYSTGPDGDPATVEDNVYTTEPRFEQFED